MKLWRIATDAKTYSADDLTGAGAALPGGRWNRAGEAALYCAPSIALTCLETVVHFKARALPFNRYLVEIDIPSKLWATRTKRSIDDLPVGWDAIPPGHESLRIVSSWLKTCSASILEVPSVVVSEVTTIVLNPAHPSISLVKARKLRRWHYDSRLPIVA